MVNPARVHAHYCCVGNQWPVLLWRQDLLLTFVFGLMMKSIKKLVFVAALGFAATAANAGIVDLYGLSGNRYQSTFDRGWTASGERSDLWAQSVKADAASFVSLSFTMSSEKGGSFLFHLTGGTPGRSIQGMPLPGTGEMPDWRQELFSQELVHNGKGAQTFNLTFNVPVTPGQTYFWSLDAFGHNIFDASVLATAFNPYDEYSDGAFMSTLLGQPFSNSSALYYSGYTNYDLVFRATFENPVVVINDPGTGSGGGGATNGVSEPSTLALLVGPALVAGVMRRRRSSVN